MLTPLPRGRVLAGRPRPATAGIRTIRSGDRAGIPLSGSTIATRSGRTAEWFSGVRR
ncbi:hypothetical protein ACFPN7_06345 [Amycolatopsis halotolerans]|uniref:hypothetical protein n=1 Tax=Amycolatopsis halotolerans TaxID=330083 RepID=UPI00361CBFAA